MLQPMAALQRDCEMSRTFLMWVEHNKLLLISVVTVIFGLVIRSCGAAAGQTLLPLCSGNNALLVADSLSHAHCVGCFVAVLGCAFATAAVVLRAMRKQSVKKYSALHVKY